MYLLTALVAALASVQTADTAALYVVVRLAIDDTLLLNVSNICTWPA
jgi:hypothetical protein